MNDDNKRKYKTTLLKHSRRKFMASIPSDEIVIAARELSPKAYQLLMYYYSKSDGWKFDDDEIAKSLGIGANMLYRWKQDIESQQSGEALSEDERVELKRLRKENKNLRMEKEILKKASAFFAEEMK